MVEKKDWCTGAPDSILGYDFGEEACKWHDYSYWDQEKSRLEADRQLRKDINKVLPWYLDIFAWIYYMVVRLIGWIPWNKYKNEKEVINNG